MVEGAGDAEILTERLVLVVLAESAALLQLRDGPVDELPETFGLHVDVEIEADLPGHGLAPRAGRHQCTVRRRTGLGSTAQAENEV
jgi:hypothetical protein